jgi:hypothetical protein
VIPNAILRDAYRELDDTGLLSTSTKQALAFAGFDVSAIVAADNASKETED